MRVFLDDIIKISGHVPEDLIPSFCDYLLEQENEKIVLGNNYSILVDGVSVCVTRNSDNVVVFDEELETSVQEEFINNICGW